MRLLADANSADLTVPGPAGLEGIFKRGRPRSRIQVLDHDSKQAIWFDLDHVRRRPE
jgi:hypothetical protein